MKSKKPSSESEVTSPQPQTSQPAKKKITIQSMDLVLLGVIVLALLGTAYRFWTAANVTAAPVAQATTSTQKVVPTLSLHQDHTRSGPDITVDPSQIGKSDPFQ